MSFCYKQANMGYWYRHYITYIDIYTQWALLGIKLGIYSTHFLDLLICCSLDVFSFTHHSLQSIETFVHENPRKAAGSDTHTTLSGANNHSTVKVTSITCIPYSDIWSEKQLNLLTMSAGFYAFSFCHIGSLNVCINKLAYLIHLLVIPNKGVTECRTI